MIESANTADLSQDILHRAMEWQVTLWSGEVSPRDMRAFECWLQVSQQHQLAWHKVQQVNQQLGQVPDQLASRVLRQTAVVDHRRRQLLVGLGIIGSLGALGFGVSQSPQWQIASADYRTGRGQRRELILPDGTQLMLNTASAMDVVFSADSRRLILYRGEVQIVTGADTGAGIARPLWVETAAGVVRPIGTQFTLRQCGKDVKVDVAEGAVELLPKQGQGIRLEAGQAAQFSRQQVSSIQTAVATDSAWTRGLLIAEQQRLGDFIANLSRYHTGILRCDPAAADLIVSGVYLLKDTHSILRTLEQVLPVRVDTWLGYWTTLSLR